MFLPGISCTEESGEVQSMGLQGGGQTEQLTHKFTMYNISIGYIYISVGLSLFIVFVVSVLATSSTNTC